MKSYTCECGDLVAAEWQFCALCGRYAGRVELSVSSADYRIAAGGPSEKGFLLRNPGHRAIGYSAHVEPGTLIRLADGSGTGEIVPGEHALALTITGVPPPDPPTLLRITTTDGPRPAEDPWSPPTQREHPPVPIRVSTVSAPRLRVLPELLVLSDERPNRELLLLNDGEDELQVTLPGLPAGIQYGGSEHQEHVTVRVPARGTLPVNLRLGGHSRDTHVTLSFRTGFGQTVGVDLVRHTVPTPDVMPAYIVGIDFGTRNSSVFVRRVGRPGVNEEILPATTSPEEPARFPSALYRAKDGNWYYGQEAVDRANDDNGEVVRNVKQFIYEHEEPYADRGAEFSRVALLTRFIRYLRGRARNFVRTRYGEELDELDVIYVCSIPLLDEERQTRIREELTQAVREAVLPRHRWDEPVDSWLRFAPEPLCAALYIILDRERVDIRDGERIAVFDSGGGTTDVVVGRVEISPGQIAFEPEEMIGLDERDRVFGGNNVTRQLIEHLSERLKRTLLDGYFEVAAPGTQREWLESKVHEAVDVRKICAVRGDTSGADLSLDIANESFWKGIDREGQYVSARDVTEAVRPFLTPLLRPVRAQLFEPREDEPARFQRSDINYIFPVGGNTLIPRVRQALRVLFEAPEDDVNERLKIMKEAEVVEAVGRGAVHVPDARLKRSAAYGLSLRLSWVGTEREDTVFTLPANSSIREQTRQKDYRFASASLQVTLLGTYGSTERVLREAVVEPPDGGHCLCRLRWSIETRPDGAWIVVRHSTHAQSGASPESLLFDYAV